MAESTPVPTARPLMRPRVVEALRQRVVSYPAGLLIWRTVIGALGLVVVVVGVALLALPGPGWVIIFLGLGVWATEFAWAGRLLSFVREQVRAWTAWTRARPRWVQGVIGLTGLIVLVAIAYLGYRILL